MLYGKSSIYWHATGYGEDNPKKFEHFGISTVEAMAAECIPVVINLGGQPEIVEQSVNGFLWNSIPELKKFSLKLVNTKSVRFRREFLVSTGVLCLEPSQKFYGRNQIRQTKRIAFPWKRERFS